MPDWLSKIFAFLKLGTPSLLALLLVSGFVLFGEEVWVHRVGLDVLRQDYKPWLGITLLLSASLLLSRAFISVGSTLADIWRKRQKSRQVMKRLHALTQDEVDVLALYIAGQTRVQQLDVANGTVATLRRAEVIRVLSSCGNVVDGWPCEIHEQTWIYLNLHPELLRLRRLGSSYVPEETHEEFPDAPN